VLDWLTRNGTGYGQSEPYAQYAPAIAEPPDGADLVEEWEFFYLLAQEMGLELMISPQLGPEMPTQPLDMTVKPTTDSILELLCRGSRVPLKTVKAHDGGAVFCDPPMHVAPGERNSPYRFRLADSDMMADLATTLAIAPSNEHPFRLVCRRMMHVYNSSFVGALPPSARPYNPAFLSPGDMARLGLVDGDYIVVQSDHDSISAIAHGDHSLRDGLVSMSFGFGGLPDDGEVLAKIGSNPARLLSADKIFDRYSGQPLMTNVAVTIRKNDGLTPE
jgi:anaerobic selenocysteine-containing dehydrogenase